MPFNLTFGNLKIDIDFKKKSTILVIVLILILCLFVVIFILQKKPPTPPKGPTTTPKVPTTTSKGTRTTPKVPTTTSKGTTTTSKGTTTTSKGTTTTSKVPTTTSKSTTTTSKRTTTTSKGTTMAPKGTSMPRNIRSVATAPSNGNECEIAQTTSLEEFSWTAVVEDTFPNETKNYKFCRASLISPSVLLTAAKCVSGKNNISLRVRVDASQKSKTARNRIPQNFEINNIRIHSKFDGKVSSNDLALISVKDNVITQYISPICIRFSNLTYPNTNSFNPSECFTIGSGKNALSKSNSQTELKVVKVNILKNDECQNRSNKTAPLSPGSPLDSSFICVDGKPGSDTSVIDDGSPLICALLGNPKKYFQVGIASWSMANGANYPRVYASLKANKDWLNTALKNI